MIVRPYGSSSQAGLYYGCNIERFRIPQTVLWLDSSAKWIPLRLYFLLVFYYYCTTNQFMYMVALHALCMWAESPTLPLISLQNGKKKKHCFSLRMQLYDACQYQLHIINCNLFLICILNIFCDFSPSSTLFSISNPKL